MSGEEDERWHVRMAPGEVKLLTLDQIDDLFRLEVIDGDTFLRQEGSKNWVPLRVVAGLDDEASEEVKSAPAPPTPSAPSLPPIGSAPPPPPSARSAPSAPIGSAPPAPPPARSAPPPPPVPLPPPSEAAPPASLPPPSVAAPPAPSAPAPSALAPSVAAPFAHSPSFMPPPPSSRGRSAPASAPKPSVAPPAVASVASVAPLPLSPPAPLLRPSRVEPLLIGLAALLGLIVVLQRNGTLATLFASAGQGAAYARLEASLGGPGFGTPRAVDALVSQSRALPPSAAATPRGVQPGARPK